MRYTLLELVQNVLSSMDSDEVNSIEDTVESKQVVAIIKTVYDDIISRGGLLSNKTLFNLVSSGDSTQPVLMTKPLGIDRIDWIQYNRILFGDTDAVWSNVTYMKPEEFIRMIYELLPSESTVDTFNYTTDGFTIILNYRNDIGPTYYTTFDDNTIIFDAYDSAVDSTLQTSKTLAYGSKTTDFIESDVFVPNLQPQQFALLLSESKSLAWSELKQTPHPKAERASRRNWIHLSKTRQNIPSGNFKSRAHAFDMLQNFGRK